MVRSKIIDLRKLLAERFPQEIVSPANQLATGITNLDSLLNGGLTKGAITELISPPGNGGSASLIAALLHRAAGERYFLALIDGRDSFDPQSIAATALRHLLWIRCHQANEAMQAADLLLRDGNFPLLILDLVLHPLAELRRIPSSNWYRLQRLIEPAPTALLALTPCSLISSAQWKLMLENRWWLSQLDWAATELQTHLRVHLQRAQPNKWQSNPALASAG
ncbi:MAG TPA: hypothetical protein VGI60_16775 [Chthoniobacterales bacterium]|jgi:hypothetical protein